MARTRLLINSDPLAQFVTVVGAPVEGRAWTTMTNNAVGAVASPRERPICSTQRAIPSSRSFPANLRRKHYWSDFPDAVYLVTFQVPNHLGLGQLYLAVDRLLLPKTGRRRAVRDTLALRAHPGSESEYNGHAEPKKILSPRESY
jgi:hypothetical protein